jgi:O-ureido-D-serine cyclo-ligase
MRRRIVVATCERAPELDDDWPRLHSALTDRGADASAAAWTDPEVNWASFDLVVIRGTWDYFARLGEFLAWVHRVAAATRLVNPAPVVAWNADKRYLDDLAADGVPVVTTTFVAPGDSWRPPEGEFVVKPTVSAGGFETARYRPIDAAAAERHLRRLLDGGHTAMVQPYLASVDREGEVALVYLGGRFSHAINKAALLQAGAGVDDELWTHERIAAMDPSPSHHRVAEATLAAAAARTGCGPTAYARVDLLADPRGQPVVSEVELIEPGLFLRYAPGAPERFAEVLLTT